jgi:predicted secreted Zn-dependent protease
MSAYASTPGDLQWRVSRTCESGACVGVARRGEYVFISNTSDPVSPISKFTTDEWRHFLAGVKLGDFDGVA